MTAEVTGNKMLTNDPAGIAAINSFLIAMNSS
jgi:hypothetical protein